MLYRVVTNALNGKRKLLPYNGEFYKLSKSTKPSYESLYLYDEKHKELFEEKGSLAGIEDVKTDKLVFDFDNKANPQLALNDARTLVERLQNKISPEAIRCYFSGNKGYHVEVRFNEGQYLTRNQFSQIVDALAADLKTFDTTIRDEQRILRLPLSKHEEGLFKYPITLEDFLNEEITHKEFKDGDYAKTLEGIEYLNDVMDNCVQIDIPETFKAYCIVPDDRSMTKEEAATYDDVPDMTHRPKHISPAKFALMQGYFNEGERNKACMALCATYKGLGYPKEVAYNMLKATLRMRQERLGLPEYDKHELWKESIEVVYSPTWKGGTYSEKEGLLADIIERYDLQKSSNQEVGLLKIGQVSDVFKDFAQNIDKNTIRLGIPELDSKVRLTTSMFVCLLAPPSSGKTSIALGILNSLSASKEKAIFFSMDMAIPQVYQRLIQRHTGHKSDQITDNYKNGNEEQIKAYSNILEEEYENVKLCFKTGLTAETIRNTIINETDVTGVTPRLIVIDYLECIAGPFTDATANKALIATQLKDIANELGVCVLLLVQPAKVSGDPSNELTSYTQIKGSSVLGEAATIVMAMNRPGFSPKNPAQDKFLTINVVKNRMGELSSTDLFWDGLTGVVRRLSVEELQELNELRARKLAESGDKDNLY